MKTFGLSLVSALLVASSAVAQRVTTTYTWDQGDTVVYTVSTDPLLGAVTTMTLTTITGPAGVTTPVTTALTTTPTTTARTTTRTTATTARTTARTTTTDDDDSRPTTTTGPRVVGQQETMDPMRTTTYWYDPGNGVWTVATWTASVTAEPTVATYIPSAGTVMDYDAYQSEVNGNLFESAKGANAAVAANAGSQNGAEGKRAGMMGWVAIVAGAVGVGAVVVGL